MREVELEDCEEVEYDLRWIPTEFVMDSEHFIFAE